MFFNSSDQHSQRAKNFTIDEEKNKTMNSPSFDSTASTSASVSVEDGKCIKPREFVDFILKHPSLKDEFCYMNR